MIPLKNPGQMLQVYFLTPMHISQYKLAKAIGVPQIRISEIVRGLRSITPDTALRLGKYFNMSAAFWINLQTNYDLRMAKRKLERGKTTIVKVNNFKIANSIATTLRGKLQF